MPNIQYFPYFGPNRRSDRTVVEVTLDFASGESLDIPALAENTAVLLRASGVLDSKKTFPARALPDDARAGFAALLAQTALLFQQRAGHRVSFFDTWCEPDRYCCIALVEHEHCDVGMTAVKLAVEVLTGKRRQLDEPWRAFSVFAGDRVLPRETEAIMAAARRRGIPCFHLERYPFSRHPGQAHCVRRNALLRLGHGPHGRVIDGTFRTDGADDHGWALLRNPAQRRALLDRLGVPVADAGETPPMHVLAIDDRFWSVEQGRPPVRQEIESLPDQAEHALRELQKELGHAPLAIEWRPGDPGQPLASGGGVLDFDLAPRLDALLGVHDLEEAVDGLLDWLFPPDSEARMPVIAITGTNGKTTTTGMVAQILRQAGLKPGMVSTNGVFLNGRQVNAEDSSSRNGHLQVLTSREVDSAVLETHHRGIMIRGFAFQDCDVAVCLNVTEDHLGEATGVESVAEMATIKRALVERASGMAVLNADDPYCLAMLEHVSAERIGLASLHLDSDELQGLVTGKISVLCVLELIQGREWLVIADGDERWPVIAANRIPATFGGAARFMISNAMHAALAAYAVGIGVEQIGAELATFMTGPETTPGRLNVYDDLPFRVICDFAHNPDGMRRLAEFADGLPADGRKVVVFAGIVGRPDGMHRNVAHALAGHFDFYFCKEYTPREGFPSDRVAPRLKEVLAEAGVPEDRITVLGSGREAVFEVFDNCRSGDLLFLLLGHVEYPQLQRWIRDYAESRDL